MKVFDVHKQFIKTQHRPLSNKNLSCYIPFFKEYFTVFVLFFSVSAYCEIIPEPLNNYNIKCYDTNDGLPQNSITDIAINSDGQLLIATYSGVVVFDGNRFSNIIPETIKPFPNAEAYKLGVGKDKAIWVGTTSSGLYRVMGNNTQQWDINNGLSSHIIRKIKPTDDGMLINSDGRVLLFRYGKEHQIEEVTIEGDLLLSTFADTEKHISTSSKKSKLAFLAKNGQVFKLTNGVTELLIPELIKNTPVSITKLMLGSDNTLWIATASKGLFRFNSYGLERFNHLPNNRLSSIVEDEDGVIWVGTSGGLCMLELGAIRNISELQGLHNQSIHSIASDATGKVFAIPYGKTNQLSYIENKKIYNKFFINEGDDGTVIHAIVEDSKGLTWIATENKIGTLIDDGVNFSIKTHIDLQSRTRGLLIDNNKIWYQQGNYLIRYEGQKKTEFLIGESNVDIRSISKAFNGDILIAEKSNTYRVSGDQIQKINIQRGIASCIHEFAEDELWVCGDGLWLKTPKKIFYFNKDNGLTDVVNGHIHDVIDDEFGNIWVISNSGLFRMLRKDIDEMILGKIKTPHFIKFSEKDGIKSSEFNSSSSGAITTSDGKLWFASQGGVVEVDPELALFKSNKVLRPFVEHLYIGDNLIPLNKWKHIAANPQTIRLQFSAVFLSDNENLSYRYRLQPYHKNWQNGNTTNFPTLKHGTYDLQVQARYYQNSWSPSFTKELTILPAWYQTWWFRIIATVLVISILFGLPFWRIRWLQRKSEKLKTLVAQQTQSLIVANKRLDRLSRLDELTGIANRREFINKIEKLCNQQDHEICLALLDVDDFKAYNDHYGHVAGDECLIQVAQVLDRFSSNNCLVARFGGEEFVMLFDSINLVNTKALINEMMHTLELLSIPHVKSSIKTTLSVSVGIACRLKNERVEKIIDRSDMAMYQAKTNGKDRIFVAQQ